MWRKEITLQDSVKKACMSMKDGITRQRVISAITKENPLLKPNPSSVSAALINLSKGEKLHVAEEGRGRKATVYSVEEELVVELSAAEQEALFDEKNTVGTGGGSHCSQAFKTSSIRKTEL